MIYNPTQLLILRAVLFHLVTLPVEWNASRRAMKILGEVLSLEELPGVYRVLSAAALTYIASATMALMELVRLLLLRSMVQEGEE
jgi:Zn-dependent membrane protease YugP